MRYWVVVNEPTYITLKAAALNKKRTGMDTWCTRALGEPKKEYVNPKKASRLPFLIYPAGKPRSLIRYPWSNISITVKRVNNSIQLPKVLLAASCLITHVRITPLFLSGTRGKFVLLTNGSILIFRIVTVTIEVTVAVISG